MAPARGGRIRSGGPRHGREQGGAHTARVKEYYSAVRPHSGYEGGYTNFMAADDQVRVRDNYGPAYDRLVGLRSAWDPDNVFRLNQNIVPASRV